MDGPTYDQIHTEAMRMWREREERFPSFARRPKPDDLDHQSGAWGLMFAEAMKRLSAARRNAPGGEDFRP